MDNAAAESFFSSLKKEQIKRRIYTARDEARSDISEYIEAFYNRRRRHSNLGLLFLSDYEEKLISTRLMSVDEIMGSSH